MCQADVLWGIVGAFMLIGSIGPCATDDTNKSIAELMLSSSNVSSYPGVAFFAEDYSQNVHFYLYTRQRASVPQQLLINDVSSLVHSEFDATRKTLLVVHGYMNNIKSPIFADTKNGALEFLDVNIIGVDWDYYTRNLNYLWVVSNTKGVGAFVSQFVEFLMAHGLLETDLHMIGHSLGAHEVGFAGKQLRANGHTAARITGLDPAFPGFYNTEDASSRLDATDATYVDCVHTCALFLGIPSPICQADFYPNKGRNVQPGCSILDLGICSHGRSFEYFAESFNPSHVFAAETCEALSLWIPRNCKDEGALMGYPAAAGGYKGLFSLTTNSRSPFAKHIIAM